MTVCRLTMCRGRSEQTLLDQSRWRSVRVIPQLAGCLPSGALPEIEIEILLAEFYQGVAFGGTTVSGADVYRFDIGLNP